MNSKEIRIAKGAQDETGTDMGKQTDNRDDMSLSETLSTYLLRLSMEEYGLLMRRALQEGCSPEELVAQVIGKMVQK